MTLTCQNLESVSPKHLFASPRLLWIERFQIDFLANHRQLIEPLVTMLNAEWLHLDNWSDKSLLASELRSNAQLGSPPLTLVALMGETLVGSASIKLWELHSHLDKQFWLGDVVVAKDVRRYGIGQALVQAVLREASVLEIRKLHLYTPDQERFYLKRGWLTVGEDSANDEGNIVMSYSML